ncbi:MAG: V-type ATP synthase subunit I [Acidobacteriota bacterium]
MSIVPLRKVTLLGSSRDIPRTLKGLQALGCMHLVPLDAAAPRSVGAAEAQGTKKARTALRFLLGAPAQRRQVEYDEDFDFDAVATEALAVRRRRRRVQARIDELEARIREVEPWGHFVLPPLDEMAGQRLWFYVVPHYLKRRMEPGALPWQVVHRDNRSEYVVLISPSEPPPEAMPVQRSRVGVVPLDELRRALASAESNLEDLQAQRWSLTRWGSLLIRNLARSDDLAARTRAREQLLREDGVFAVQGWVPVPELARLSAFAEEEGLACVHSEPAHDEAPPVLLSNPPPLEPGEDLVRFYQIPGYRDWDPSPVVYISFALFFAMILADAAYGALLGLLTLVLWPRMGAEPSSRRLRRMFMAIAAASTAYGVLVGSYFGAAPPEGSHLARVHLVDATDFASMMPLSIGIGVAHLVLANLITAWIRRRQWSALAPIGWCLVLIGGFIAYLGARTAGLSSLGIGLVVVTFFTSQRPLTGPGAFFLRIVDGLFAWTRISKAFGDTLSYLRLFALGLSSASLAVTFNRLGTEVMGNGLGIPLVLGLLVLILGHGLNILLGIVGGVVHGLRLNVIELYNWSIFDEGTSFRAFRHKALSVRDVE